MPADGTEFPKTPFATSAAWQAFKDRNSDHYGKLTFRLDQDSLLLGGFPRTDMGGACGLFLRGALVYLNSPVTRVTLGTGTQVLAQLRPSSNFVQRFRNRDLVDGEPQFTDVEFAAPTDAAGTMINLRLADFVYTPSDDELGCMPDRRVDVWNERMVLCMNEDWLPPGTCPANGLQWCLGDTALEDGNFEDYFGTPPAFADSPTNPSWTLSVFNQAAAQRCRVHPHPTVPPIRCY